MVEPIAYDHVWQKFEIEIYRLVKQSLTGKFKVDWHYELEMPTPNGIEKSTPDVLALIQCLGCEDTKDYYPCLIPAIIFDAHCAFRTEGKFFEEKNKQMKKYSRICNSILIMPQGYEQMPYCKSKGGEYHIISKHYLSLLLESIMSEAKIGREEDVCGERPTFDSTNVYRHFELSIRKRIDRCPACNSEVFPISLIYCSNNNEFLHPDFLDYEEVRNGVVMPTHCECKGCDAHEMLDQNYENCDYSTVESKYQCRECGAVIDSDVQSIIQNFSPSQIDEIEDFPYYEELHKKHH